MVQAGGGEGAIFTQSVQGQRLHVWSSSSLSLHCPHRLGIHEIISARDTRNNVSNTIHETSQAMHEAKTTLGEYETFQPRLKGTASARDT
jgi:hypothetical protein